MLIVCVDLLKVASLRSGKLDRPTEIGSDQPILIQWWDLGLPYAYRETFLRLGDGLPAGTVTSIGVGSMELSPSA
jgi:hypothetical protein